MKVTIELDVDPDTLTREPSELKQMVECWVYDSADADIEAVDPNSGDVIGTFSYVSTDRNIRVTVEGS